MNYEALEKLEDFVFECLLQYSEQGIIDDPSQEWNQCHNPKPSCLGGEETTKLLRKHHAIHGVLQSEAYQHPCVWSWERKYLIEPEHIELFDKWMSEKMIIANSIIHAETNEDGQSIHAVKSGKIGAAVVHAERNENNQSIHALKSGEERGKKCRKPVLLTKKTTGETYLFPSGKEAARQLNLNQASVSRVALGKEKQTGGFTAVYI